MKFCRLKYIILHEIPYWIKCRLWYRYNVLKIKSLPPTWCDRDHLLCHAMFQVLSDFIEKEKPDEIIDWDSDPEHRHARDKMDELNNWFHNVYLKFDAWEGIELNYSFDDDVFIPCKDNLKIYEMKPFTKEQKAKMDLINKRELDMDKELEKRLRELLDIRKYLWT